MVKYYANYVGSIVKKYVGMYHNKKRQMDTNVRNVIVVQASFYQILITHTYDIRNYL